MKILFLAIQQLLISKLTAYNLSYVRVWNNQLERLLGGEISDFALMNETGDTPAILIEFVSPATIEQLGNGDQIYNPFGIRLHILHQFYDAQNGTQDQDLVVLDIANDIYDVFQDWMPDTVTIDGNTYQVPVGVMVRTSEEWDYDHPDVYHFIQEYTTTWVDSRKNRPENGILSDPNDTLTLNINPT